MCVCSLALLIWGRLPGLDGAAQCTLGVLCCFNDLLSEQGLGGAALHICLSSLSFLWVGQPCMNAQSYFVSSVPSPARQPWTCAQKHITPSAWSSPVCGYCKVLLALHFPWVGSPHLGMQQCPTVSTLSMDRAVLCAGSIAF